MKKIITTVCCLLLVACALTGCGGNKAMNTTDTTEKPSSIFTEPTTHTTEPTSASTLPSALPDNETVPGHSEQNTNGDSNSANGTDGVTRHNSNRSRTHAPSIVGGSR